MSRPAKEDGKAVHRAKEGSGFAAFGVEGQEVAGEYRRAVADAV